MIYIVVDAGGTKTNAVVFNEQGNILGRGKSGTGNARLSDVDTAVNNVSDACISALNQADKTSKDVEKCYLFIPGFSECKDTFDKKMNFHSEMKSEEDELHYSALKGDDGIIILAGTGSFAVYFLDGNSFRLGGWGAAFGDEGSGYYIGLETLKKCAIDFDDGKDTQLISAVTKYLGLDSFHYARSLYKRKNMREAVAGLCILVDNLACEGDSDALNIISQSVDQLVTMANRVYIKSNSKEKTLVTLSGGLANSKLICQLFAKKLKKSNEKLKYVANDNDIIKGAMLCLLNDVAKDKSNKNI